MTSARHAADSRLAAVTYAGPEWMGKANWHSVAETYLFKALGKPGLYALTRLMLAVNRRFPDVLLNRRYDGLERLMGWVPGVSNAHGAGSAAELPRRMDVERQERIGLQRIE